MIARTQLATLDHNCGTDRKYVVSAKGEIQQKISYTKETNQCVSKKIRVPKEKNISQIFKMLS